MPALVAIGYPDQTSAAAAGEEVVRLSAQLDVAPDAVAVLALDPAGVYRATTHVHGTGGAGGPALWFALFGAVVLEPARTPRSEALRAAVERTAGARITPRFAGQVRGLLAPRASALFVLVDDDGADGLREALARYGGRAVIAR